MFRPRQGVIKGFKTRDMLQTTSLVLFFTLQSLKLALKLKSLGLKDLEIVSSKLVKFLHTNTGYKSIEQLEKYVATLQSSSLEVSKTDKMATASANTTSNKVDTLTKHLNAMEERLFKLEKGLESLSSSFGHMGMSRATCCKVGVEGSRRRKIWER